MNKKRVPNKIRLPNWEKPTWMCSKSSDLFSSLTILLIPMSSLHQMLVPILSIYYYLHKYVLVRGIIVQFQRPDKRKTLINVSRGMEN